MCFGEGGGGRGRGRAGDMTECAFSPLRMTGMQLQNCAGSGRCYSRSLTVYRHHRLCAGSNGDIFLPEFPRAVASFRLVARNISSHPPSFPEPGSSSAPFLSSSSPVIVMHAFGDHCPPPSSFLSLSSPLPAIP